MKLNEIKKGKKNSFQKERTPDLSWFYKKRYFFTRNEYQFFDRLLQIIWSLDHNKKYILFSKTKVRDIITLQSWRHDPLKRTNQRHFDFLICDSSKAYEPIIAIELDDSSHNTKTTKERDRLKNLLCETVWLPLLRFYQTHTDDEIKTKIWQLL